MLHHIRFAAEYDESFYRKNRQTISKLNRNFRPQYFPIGIIELLMLLVHGPGSPPQQSVQYLL